MATYVDAAEWPYGRMMMCHLMADTRQELIDMVDKIGVNRRHYQHRKGSTPHFDICKAKRALAVKAGAIECSREGIVEVMRRYRANPEAFHNPETAPRTCPDCNGWGTQQGLDPEGPITIQCPCCLGTGTHSPKPPC